MLRDRYGNSCSTQSTIAMERYDEALELLRLFRGDPIAALDAALEADPELGAAWAARAGLLAQQTDAAYSDEIARSLRAGQAANLNDRERRSLEAAQAWADGRYHAGTTAYARIAQDHPRDALAVQYAHAGCFFTGRQFELRDIPLQALRAFAPGEDGHGVLQGMAAFGLEECGAYDAAEDMGRAAVEADPRDGWAVHAVAHVHEMRGDLQRGVRWLADSASAWAPESAFAYHNWWHLALLQLDRGSHDEALALYDAKIRPDPAAQILLEAVDASALLWRLHLEGVDVGDRFVPLAATWERTMDDRVYAFNDVHAIMAYLGAGRMRDAERALSSLRAAAAGAGDNAEMARTVGAPVAEALLAFTAGRHAECVETLLAVRGVAQRFGGSHAQRDVLTLTTLHAALRGGLRGAAEALGAERISHKPESPWARRLARRAELLA